MTTVMYDEKGRFFKVQEEGNDFAAADAITDQSVVAQVVFIVATRILPLCLVVASLSFAAH